MVAEAWADILRDVDIRKVYTSNKLRTKQTDEHIARKLKIAVAAMPRRDIVGLEDKICKEHTDEAVLIVSHHSKIPRLVKKFAPLAENFKIEDDDCGSLFIISPEESGEAAVFRIRY